MRSIVAMGRGNSKGAGERERGVSLHKIEPAPGLPGRRFGRQRFSRCEPDPTLFQASAHATAVAGRGGSKSPSEPPPPTEPPDLRRPRTRGSSGCSSSTPRTDQHRPSAAPTRSSPATARRCSPTSCSARRSRASPAGAGGRARDSVRKTGACWHAPVRCATRARLPPPRALRPTAGLLRLPHRARALSFLSVYWPCVRALGRATAQVRDAVLVHAREVRPPHPPASTCGARARRARRAPPRPSPPPLSRARRRCSRRRPTSARARTRLRRRRGRGGAARARRRRHAAARDAPRRATRVRSVSRALRGSRVRRWHERAERGRRRAGRRRGRRRGAAAARTAAASSSRAPPSVRAVRRRGARRRACRRERPRRRRRRRGRRRRRRRARARGQRAARARAADADARDRGRFDDDVDDDADDGGRVWRHTDARDGHGAIGTQHLRRAPPARLEAAVEATRLVRLLDARQRPLQLPHVRRAARRHGAVEAAPAAANGQGPPAAAARSSPQLSTEPLNYEGTSLNERIDAACGLSRQRAAAAGAAARCRLLIDFSHAHPATHRMARSSRRRSSAVATGVSSMRVVSADAASVPSRASKAAGSARGAHRY